MPYQSKRPDTTEYAEFYAGYVSVVPDGNVIETLRRQRSDFVDLFRRIPPEKVNHRYAPGKWSIKEVLGHVCDTEWIFTYRALTFARGDSTPLPGMDQNEYMAGSDFNIRTMDSLIDQFIHLRGASVNLFEGFNEHTLNRMGTASGFPVSVRALIWIIAGHGLHHANVLKNKYL